MADQIPVSAVQAAQANQTDLKIQFGGFAIECFLNCHRIAAVKTTADGTIFQNWSNFPPKPEVVVSGTKTAFWVPTFQI